LPESYRDHSKASGVSGAYELIEKSRSVGLRQVVVTGRRGPIGEAPDGTFEDYRLHRESSRVVNGVATGRLLPPVLAAATKASWIRQFAEREGINLSDSYAYSDSMSDLPMLSVVGHPAAVNPDMRLRQTPASRLADSEFEMRQITK